MTRKTLTLSLLVLLLGMPLWAQSNEQPAPAIQLETPAHDPPPMEQKELEALLLKDFANSIQGIRTLGLLVFSTPFNTLDGLGDGPFDATEVPPMMFGHRPTLQGNGVFLRLHGLDAQSCNECHTIVTNATKPPTTGIAGVGGLVQSAFPLAQIVELTDGFDNRLQYIPGYDPDLPLVHDGVADFNGRFINPPFLFGGGGVELIGKEMTQELQKILYKARHGKAGEFWPLMTSHGVDFGYLISLGNHEVEMHLEGIGLEDPHLSAEEQLVVRPFGRKGENFSMRDFDRGAMQFHFGIQPNEVFGANTDEDGDGVFNEITDVEMSFLHIFDVTNPPSYMEPLNPNAQQGEWLFREQVGCNDCHRAEIRTRYKTLPLAHPEDPTDPWNKNVYVNLPMTKFGFAADPYGTGIIVPLFSDLKRHDMGPGLAETCEHCEGIANEEFITARLWGIADTAPYLHDGRATTLYQAIMMHGGEAQYARDNFANLPPLQQYQVLEFLRHLRTPENPNDDILP